MDKLDKYNVLFGLGGAVLGAVGAYMAMAPKSQAEKEVVKSDPKDPKDLSNFPLPSTITDLKYSQ